MRKRHAWKVNSTSSGKLEGGGLQKNLEDDSPPANGITRSLRTIVGSTAVIFFQRPKW